MQIEVGAGLVDGTVLILVHLKLIDIDDGSCHVAQHPEKEVNRVKIGRKQCSADTLAKQLQLLLLVWDLFCFSLHRKLGHLYRGLCGFPQSFQKMLQNVKIVSHLLLLLYYSCHRHIIEVALSVLRWRHLYRGLCGFPQSFQKMLQNVKMGNDQFFFCLCH